LLAEHFLSIYNKKYNRDNLIFEMETLKRLENYSWPGNIRELKHSIERSVILCEGNSLKPTDLFLKSPQTKNSEEEEFDTYNLDDIEKRIIRKALLKYEGNISKAANELGLTRTSLYRRMEKHGL